MKKLISLVLCLLLALSFVACQQSPAEQAVSVLEAQLAALKSGEFAKSALLENGAFANEDDNMLSALYSKLEYKIGEAKQVDKLVVVPVEITTVDMAEAFAKYMTDALSHLGESDWDADGSYFAELLQSDGAATKTFSVAVNMLQDAEGNWKVAEEGNDSLMDALTGGLMNALGGLGDMLD